jgi:hypothetical protein
MVSDQDIGSDLVKIRGGPISWLRDYNDNGEFVLEQHLRFAVTESRPKE